MWLDEDRAWALALQAEEDTECAGCGQPLDESTDKANETAYDTVVYRCHACTTKDRGGEKYKEAPSGIYVGVSRRSR